MKRKEIEVDTKTIVTSERLITVIKLPNGKTQLLFFKRDSIKPANAFTAAGNVVLDRDSLAELAAAITVPETSQDS